MDDKKTTNFPEEVKETDVLIALQEAKDTIATIKGNLRYALRSRDDDLIKQTVIETVAML